MRNILKVISGYVAAIIGAGFASGQEIVGFFVRYGKYSVIGIVLACVIFSLFAYIVLAVCIDNNVNSYADYLNAFFRGNIRYFVQIMTLAFSVSAMCVMTACTAEMMFVLFGVKKIIGAVLFNVICGIIFLQGSKRIMNVNSVLGFVIIFGIVFSCLYILNFRENQVLATHSKMILSSVSYAGYNLISTGAILVGMSGFLNDKKEACAASVGAGVVIGIIMLLVWTLLQIYYGKINLGEIPMLTLSLRQGKLFGMFYALILFFAVLTTGISNGFGIMDMTKEKVGEKKSIALILSISVALSGAGFENIVNTAYRICGYGGMITVFYLIWNFFKKSELERKMK